MFYLMQQKRNIDIKNIKRSQKIWKTILLPVMALVKIGLVLKNQILISIINKKKNPKKKINK